MKEYKLEWKSWGKRPNQAMRHQEDWFEYPYCAHRRVSFYPFVIGYDPDYDRLLVIECPECFEHFTSHMHHSDSFLINQARNDPDYFKVPGAKKALLKMLRGLKDE